MYQLPKLAKVPGLVHGMSELRHGSQSFRHVKHPSDARGNREVFLKDLQNPPGGYPLFMIGNGISIRPGFRPPLHVEREIRSVRFLGQERSWGMFREEDELPAEALITQDGGIFFFLTVADCFPVVLFDPMTRTLALVHVSRVTAISRIEEKGGSGPARHFAPLLSRVMDVLIGSFAVKAENLLAAIGPGIARNSYELDWFERAHDPEWHPFLAVGNPGKVQVDLAGYSRWLLEGKGIAPKNIEISDLDTMTARNKEGDCRFFSHRRAAMNGEAEGRNAFAVGMSR
ncbi:MAG: polyphenol oxidase family protein [Candidatus Sungbacteria bacterium]|uniref:Polyphenol oxidase family protein n=1 Tax=Candidatus Sungiibacteriota bacterium TaxID=2750080 RepID=A0A932YZH8_9BACT|nr:polyphenol oxidase family protein [Candidatus Sungbacteria bacterium]